MIALIAGAPSLLAAILSFANNVLARKHTKQIEQAASAIITLEKNTNSIKDALVKVTGEEAFARGLSAGQQAQTGPAGPPGETGATGERGPKGH